MALTKRQQLDKCNNKEKQELNKNKSEFEGDRFILFPPLALPLLPQKESNCPSDLGKRTKSLNHFVCIS